jgi:predicted RNase H-like HicB family nuclease
MADRLMTFAEFLRVPYLLRSTSVRAEDGQWLRHVEYPELPGCSATGAGLTDAMDELDRRRVHLILDLLNEGRRPPLPRAPITGVSPVDELTRLGLTELVGLVEHDERRLRDEPHLRNRPRGHDRLHHGDHGTGT